MKKLIAMLLAAVMVVCLVACGTINETEVAILWSGDGIVHVPNSLINAVERAMYIENISYTYYGANGNQAQQTTQALSALEAGCAALVVELVDSAAAQEIIDAAKAKNVPVVFLNSDVDSAVLSSYDRCAAVLSDEKSVGNVLGEYIIESMKDADIEEWDRNKDGKISYVTIGDVASTVSAMTTLPIGEDNDASGITALVINAVSAVTAPPIPDITSISDFAALTVQDGETDKDLGQLLTADGTSVELIITADDASAQEVLKALQEKGFNSTKLKTHCIPLYTVGNEFDAKDFADPDKYEPEEWEALIFTTTDLISSGYITGAAVTDYDNTAIVLARVVANLISGSARFDGIPEENISGSTVRIPYTIN